MSKVYNGGRACGALRYEIKAEPIARVECQCRNCQRDSGTGHTSNMVFPRGAAKIVGETSQWNAVGEQGTVRRALSARHADRRSS
jgi:hypothetical protein